MTSTNVKNNKKRGLTWQEVLFVINCLAIPVVSFLVFYVYVNLDSFAMGFQVPQADGSLVWSLDNFKWVFDKMINGSTLDVDNLKLAFINTFKTFLIQMVMLFVGLLVSYAIYKKILGYKAFRVVFYLPSIISSVVTSLFYIELMNSNFVPDILETLFHLNYEMKSPLTDSDFANGMVFLNYIWLSIPCNMILWGGAFSRIPVGVLESARIDGAGWVRELFQVILPIVWPTLVIILTTSIANIFGATGAVFLLTEGQYGTQTVSNWMYMRVQQAYGDMDPVLYRVSALGLLLTVVSCALALTIRKVLNSRVEEVTF